MQCKTKASAHKSLRQQTENQLRGSVMSIGHLYFVLEFGCWEDVQQSGCDGKTGLTTQIRGTLTCVNNSAVFLLDSETLTRA